MDNTPFDPTQANPAPTGSPDVPVQEAPAAAPAVNTENSGFYPPVYPGAPSAPTPTAAPTQMPPISGGAPSPAAPQTKKKAPLLRISIILLCALLFVGGVLLGFFSTGWFKSSGSSAPQNNLPVQGIEGDTDNTQDNLDTSFDPGVFDPVYGNDSTTYSAAEIYENCVNGVVGISTEITQQNIFGQQNQAVSGTGFIFSEDGYILTNCHVVEDGRTITVKMYDGTIHEATLIGGDNQNDIAVLKIETEEKLPTLPIGKSENMVVGEEILVIGNPLGELTHTLTRGIVSNLSREILVEDSLTTIRMFQTDAAINSGNSGGPAIDCHGNVIGVVSAKYASSSIEGLGFCIPIDDAMEIAEDLIEHGYVKGRAFLGIEGQAVGGYVGSTYLTGVRVTAVNADSCAEKAGIRRGDILIEFEGEKVETIAGLKSILAHYNAGDTVEFTVYRNGESILLTGILDEAVN